MAEEAKSALSAGHVLNCQVSSWLPVFRKHTIKTEVMELPPEFTSYLLKDGINLPTNLMPQSFPGESDDDEESDGEEWSSRVDAARDRAELRLAAGVPEEASSSDDEEETEEPNWSIPTALLRRLRDTIDRLGGAVYPRLNWTSPRDAAWVAADKTLKCNTPGDIVLLLKASSAVAQEIEDPFAGCYDAAEVKRPPVELALRQWSNLLPSREFRCFVRDRKLVAVSQRDSHYYEHLNTQEEQRRVKEKLGDFFTTVILPGFPDDNYVFDAYIDSGGRVWLLAFKAWGSPRTDPLLFSWEELQGEAPLSEAYGDDTDTAPSAAPSSPSPSPALRVIRSEGSAASKLGAARSIVQRLPVDGIDLSDSAGIERFARAAPAMEPKPVIASSTTPVGRTSPDAAPPSSSSPSSLPDAAAATAASNGMARGGDK